MEFGTEATWRKMYPACGTSCDLRLLNQPPQRGGGNERSASDLTEVELPLAGDLVKARTTNSDGRQGFGDGVRNLLGVGLRRCVHVGASLICWTRTNYSASDPMPMREECGKTQQSQHVSYIFSPLHNGLRERVLLTKPERKSANKFGALKERK